MQVMFCLENCTHFCVLTSYNEIEVQSAPLFPLYQCHATLRDILTMMLFTVGFKPRWLLAYTKRSIFTI